MVWQGGNKWIQCSVCSRRFRLTRTGALYSASFLCRTQDSIEMHMSMCTRIWILDSVTYQYMFSYYRTAAFLCTLLFQHSVICTVGINKIYHIYVIICLNCNPCSPELFGNSRQPLSCLPRTVEILLWINLRTLHICCTITWTFDTPHRKYGSFSPSVGKSAVPIYCMFCLPTAVLQPKFITLFSRKANSKCHMNSCRKINTLEIILPHVGWNSDRVGFQCFHSGTRFNMMLWIRFLCHIKYVTLKNPLCPAVL